MSDIKILTGPEVAKHNSRESCWIIVHGKVYDVTDFLDGTPESPVFHLSPPDDGTAEHPGGSRIILKYAGQDAT